MRSDGFLSFSLFSRPASFSALLSALLVVFASALLIAPLPGWLLDLFLAANLGFSLLVLLAAISARSMARRGGFPTLFLVTTLVRLVLSVAVCRAILLDGNAGQVVSAFGHFVVRNNYIAGAVIFLTLVVIQLLVLAKGSERSAEVAARFALDGLPGKQMAIDAELRSNAISNAEAQRKREHLAAESQFYGAMDGAMKLIKGDVAASLIITAVNFGAGVSIGMLHHELSATDALRRYGLLALGAGLVVQLASLLVSTASGILVTRSASIAATSSDSPANHSFGTPTALRAVALAALALALVPGMPAWPFVLMAATLVAFSLLRERAVRAEPKRRLFEALAAAEVANLEPLVRPWSLEVSDDLAPLLETRNGLSERLRRLQDEVLQEFGVPLPAGVLKVSSKLAAGNAQLALWEVPALTIELATPSTPEESISLLVTRTGSCLRARAADFIGLSETQLLLDRLEQHAPATVNKVVPHPIRLPLLTEILRRLVAEGVSIRDLRAILEALAQAPAQQKEPGELADFVRARLQRSLTYQLTRGTPALDVIVLDTVVEDTLRGSLPVNESQTGFSLAPAVARDLIAATKRAVDEAEAAAPDTAPVVLAAPDIRRVVHRLLATDFPELRVISPTELLPELRLNSVATVNVRGIV